MALRRDPPNEALARELADVARDADALSEALRAPNQILPETFPTPQVIAICRSLAELPEGTAEGCRAPLEYARVRLPAIRRAHILGADQAPLPQHEDEAPPPIRGMGLDRLVRDLIASVTTALDEYRQQASEHVEDTVGAELAVDAEGVAGVGAAMAQSEAVEQTLRGAGGTISETTVAGSSRAERLRRTVKDAENVNRVARAELGMKPVVLRWFRAVAEKLEDYPSLIRKFGDAIVIGADVAQPLNQRWSDFWTNFGSFVFTELRECGQALLTVADNLERHRSRSRQAGDERTPAIEPEMVAIEPGSFTMGSEEAKAEKPPHPVTIGYRFAMGKDPVTFAEYDAFCGATASRAAPGRGRVACR